ncbi:MAG: SRPBCC family protein [Pseudomonadota bacterium]
MSITQELSFSTSPEHVYSALMSADEFGKVTGAPAEIDASEGAGFSCFGGQITGRQIELKPNERIVQAWRAGNWPEGSYSIVQFDISGSEENTKLVLKHDGFPDGSAEHLEGGWHKMYWEPLAKYFEKAGSEG